MREPLSVLENLKRQLGSDAFSAQYQQMPVPPGGAMIKRHWIQRYTNCLREQERLIILQSWDTANKGGPENDFSVCTTWFVTRKRRWYLIDVWRKRVDYPELKAAVRDLAARHKAKTSPRRGRRGRDLACSRVARRGLRHRRGETGSRQDQSHGRRLGEIRVWTGLFSRARALARGFRIRALRVPGQPDFRAVLEAPWYRSLFPNTRIGQYKNSETEIELTARGFRLATSVGGTLTGRGGDIIVIDDPLKPDDALSETRRTAANQWFTNTLLSRLDDKRTGAIIIVMQRVHMDDLTGFVTDQSDEWEILNLPAIAEADEVIPISDTKVHRRRVGEALSPVREPLSVLENLKVQLGSDAFSAQYQQMPVPPGGAMIKRNWVQRYDELPPRQERLIILAELGHGQQRRTGE